MKFCEEWKGRQKFSVLFMAQKDVPKKSFPNFWKQGTNET